MIIFKNIFLHQNRLTHTLSKSPQWLSDYHFSPRYGQNRFFGGPEMPNSQIWLFGPRPPKNENFKNNFFHQMRLTHTVPTSPEWLSDDHFKPRYEFIPIFAILGTLCIGATLLNDDVIAAGVKGQKNACARCTYFPLLWCNTESTSMCYTCSYNHTYTRFTMLFGLFC